MENFKTSNQQIVRQAGGWLKDNQVVIIDAFADCLWSLNGNAFSRITRRQTYVFAAATSYELVRRIEGNVFNATSVKACLAVTLEAGVELKDLTDASDVLVKVVRDKADRYLYSQPEIREVLMQRVNYFANLLKATMAMVSLEHEAKLWLNHMKELNSSQASTQI